MSPEHWTAPAHPSAPASAAASPRDGSANVALVAAWIAASLGIASAAVSAYWALGGTALLDTVGGEIERWGRERSGVVVAALWLITAAKIMIAVAPLAMTGLGDGQLRRLTTARPTRLLCWLIALGLTLYGGVLSAAGLLVEGGLFDPDVADADRRALTWHTYLWDPWFASWGAALTVTMWRTRTTPAQGNRAAGIPAAPTRQEALSRPSGPGGVGR